MQLCDFGSNHVVSDIFIVQGEIGLIRDLESGLCSTDLVDQESHNTIRVEA